VPAPELRSTRFCRAVLRSRSTRRVRLARKCEQSGGLSELGIPDEVVGFRHEGLSWREIGRKMPVGNATVGRVYKEWRASQAAVNGEPDFPEPRTTVVDQSSLAARIERRAAGLRLSQVLL